MLGTLLPLIERGQAAGDFRTDVPAAWHLAMLMALIHVGSAELQARRVPEADAEAALVATVVGAIRESRGARDRHRVADEARQHVDPDSWAPLRHRSRRA